MVVSPLMVVSFLLGEIGDSQILLESSVHLQIFIISFPDSRRNQVESLTSVILYFQSSFNYRVVNLCFERMNIVVIAFWFDNFFKKNPKQWEGTWALSCCFWSSRPRKEGKKFGFSFIYVACSFFLACTLWLLSHKTL